MNKDVFDAFHIHIYDPIKYVKGTASRLARSKLFRYLKRRN
ncbi:hypothetical protein ENTCAN_06067 [Enterobacter cancerogenus ATCC 35316]|nr:hypothetical protein ENTCAN_06067 [Enterobacter cancerogenus ATCC 35316]